MKVLVHTVVVLAATVFAAAATAKPWWMRGVPSNEGDFLPPDEAFRVSSRVDGNQVRVHWFIADRYYLYRQRMEIAAESPDLVLSAPSFPRGTPKTDPYLGTQEIYQQQVEASVSFTRQDAGAHPLQIRVTYQGCAEAGLCYPPISKVLFPGSAPVISENLTRPGQPVHPWETIAIVAGGLAFLMAGFVLRRGRQLPTPQP